jgi:hypothetical protein
MRHCTLGPHRHRSSSSRHALGRTRHSSSHRLLELLELLLLDQRGALLLRLDLLQAPDVGRERGGLLGPQGCSFQMGALQKCFLYGYKIRVVSCTVSCLKFFCVEGSSDKVIEMM